MCPLRYGWEAELAGWVMRRPRRKKKPFFIEADSPRALQMKVDGLTWVDDGTRDASLSDKDPFSVEVKEIIVSKLMAELEQGKREANLRDSSAARSLR